MNFSKLAEENQWPRSKPATDQGRTSQPWQTPLTGRDTELSLLKDRWEQAQEGMGQVVLVIGQAGLGKSRLVQTLIQSLQKKGQGSHLEMDEQRADRRDDSPILIDWRCSEQFRNSELYPVTDYLERFMNAGHEESAADHFERLARHLEDCDLGAAGIVALFREITFATRGPDDIRNLVSHRRASASKPFPRCAPGCSPVLALAQCSLSSRICTGLTPRLWSFSPNLSARVRMIEFSLS